MGKGEAEIEGLTDKQVPRRLGPKRVNNIRKLFSLEKSDPVTQYVIRRTIEKEGKKTKLVAKSSTSYHSSHPSTQATTHGRQALPCRSRPKGRGRVPQAVGSTCQGRQGKEEGATTSSLSKSKTSVSSN